MQFFRISLFFISVLFCITPGFSSDTLTLETYLDIVSENYPLIRKANLYDEFAKAYDLKRRGALDPKLASSFQGKKFKDINYFTVWQTEAKVPTALPIDFSLGYEKNDGSFLNNENTVPDRGLIYGTLNLSLLRGLMFDTQRYSMQMAELNGLKSQIEKELLTREILYHAILSYLSWSNAYYHNQVVENYYQNIQDRHLNILDLHNNGDIPAIDTTESRININTANKRLLEAQQKVNIYKQKLALFLWDNDEKPLSLLPTVKPASLPSTTSLINALSDIEDLDFQKDPLIQKLENEIDQLNLQNRLERENLKPQLDLKYNTIVNLGKENSNPSYSLNDYKLGVSLELPILNRKTKGNIRLNEASIEQSRLVQVQYRQDLINKFEIINTNKVIQLSVIDVLNEKINNSQTLYEAELLKLDIGESSVFMINQREQKLLEARIDLLKSYFKYGKTVSELYYLKLGQS